MKVHRVLLLVLVPIASVTAGLPTHAQAVIEGTETIDFDRPEAWAQKYFTSVTMLTGFGAPRYIDRWSVGLELEAAWVPHLSGQQRTVGFNGTKEEDLNKTDVFGRLGVTVGLPWRLSLMAAYTPPIELNGVESNLFGLALGRPVLDAGVARFGVRLHGQTGTVKGDFTCSADVAAAGDDPLRNPFGCEAPSGDELRTRYAGLEVGAAFPGRAGKIEPFLTASSNYVDTEFQVNAATPTSSTKRSSTPTAGLGTSRAVPTSRCRKAGTWRSSSSIRRSTCFGPATSRPRPTDCSTPACWCAGAFASGMRARQSGSKTLRATPAFPEAWTAPSPAESTGRTDRGRDRQPSLDMSRRFRNTGNVEVVRENDTGSWEEARHLEDVNCAALPSGLIESELFGL